VIRLAPALALAIALVLGDLSASAQQASSVPVVGVLMVYRGPGDFVVSSVRKGLTDLGYVDGRNIKVEYRAAQGQLDLLPQLAEELMRLGARVIVVGAEPPARAVEKASGTVPIVIVAADHDPVASGLINSYSHPSGNITGIFSRQSELVGKRLELLKEALPNTWRVAVFWDTNSQRQLEEVEPAARVVGVQLERIELRAPYDFAAAFRAAKRKNAKAVMVLFSPVFEQERARLVDSAHQNRMPTVFQFESSVVAGGLMSYGPSVPALFQRSAYYIDRLLKGAKVSDLPVEQASNFKLVINLKTANALGITIPESVLSRADEVIR